MATMDVGAGHGGKRSFDHQIPLIPFIDFLLCLVSFLLITAVWSQMSRLEADARVPGPSDGATTERPDRVLHVETARSDVFRLVWKQGSTVLQSSDVPRRATRHGADEISYPALAERVIKEWSTNESRHWSVTDEKLDRAVLHTDNGTEFREVAAIIDALSAPQRSYRMADGREVRRPAFNVVFAVN